MKEKVISKVNLIASAAEAKWNELEGVKAFTGKSFSEAITVNFFRESSDFGFAQQREFHLNFNLDFIEHYGIDKCLDWIIHEVAHLVAGLVHPFARQKHGKEFRAICKELGGTGKTKHDFDIGVSMSEDERSSKEAIACICGKTMYLTRTQMRKIKDAPGDFYARCCGTTLDRILE